MNIRNNLIIKGKLCRVGYVFYLEGWEGTYTSHWYWYPIFTTKKKKFIMDASKLSRLCDILDMMRFQEAGTVDSLYCLMETLSNGRSLVVVMTVVSVSGR